MSQGRRTPRARRARREGPKRKPRAARARRTLEPGEEVVARLAKALRRAAAGLGWSGSEIERRRARFEVAFAAGEAKALRAGEQLFRLAGKLGGRVAPREMRQAASLFRLRAQLERARGADDILRTALIAIQDAIPFESATGFLYDSAGIRLVPSVVVGAHVDLIPDVAFEHGVGISSWVAKSRRPILLSALRRDAEMPETDRPASFLSVPLLNGEALVGVLNLAHRTPGAFDLKDRDLLVLVARFVSEAIAREPAVHGEIDRDDDLAPRRHLEVRVEEEVLGTARGGPGFAVVGFRLAPPGEDAGERARHAAMRGELLGLLRHEADDGRVVARFDDHGAIAFLLPQVNALEAGRWATNVRARLSAAWDPERAVTLAIATVVHPQDAETGAELLARVESLLAHPALLRAPSDGDAQALAG